MRSRVSILPALLGALALAHAPCSLAEPVATESGRVEGVRSGPVLAFKGIPYAAPPLGELRWRAPQAAAPWSEVKHADRFAPSCPQRRPYPPQSVPEAMSEDCLALNVWAPVAASKLPVMVWIHGGGLEGGSGSIPLYAGDRLAARGVVIVTFNYRLGVLGFLAHPGLSKESDRSISGNYGLLDQIAALRWVQRNIAAFGGDPDRVTVFGQSSGAISISALVASPMAKGLFRRAIAQSGGLFEPVEVDSGFTLAGAERSGERFAARVGAMTVEDLRRRPVDELLAPRFTPQFAIDGVVFTKPPFDAYATGAHNDVDLLLGANADEGRWFLDDRAITAGNVREVLASHFPAALVRLVGVRPAANDAEARAAAAAFETDMRFRWNMWAWAHQAADAVRSKVFFYQFSRTPPFRPGDRYHGKGATHGMELPYVFDQLDQQALAWTAQDRELARIIPAYWVRFATTGDPNAPGLPAWPGFGSSREQTMNLGDTIGPMAIPEIDRLQRIDRVYAAARFVSRHRVGVIVVAVLAVVAVVVLLFFGLRKPLRRRRLRLLPVRP